MDTTSSGAAVQAVARVICEAGERIVRVYVHMAIEPGRGQYI